MFAVGHLAFGYMIGKASSRISNLKVSIPLIFTFSVLPDIDLLIPYLVHRGPTHSIIVMILISLPFLVTYGKTVIPYLLATAQHSLIGDFLTGGTQLFWPINQGWYGLPISVLSQVNITMEWVFLLVSLTLMLKAGDFHELLKPHPLNLALILPTFAICSQMLTGLPIKIPIELFVPHFIYLFVFALAILKDIKYVYP